MGIFYPHWLTRGAKHGHFHYWSKEIMYLVASVCMSVCLPICLSVGHRSHGWTVWPMNWYVSWPWPWLGWDCRSRSQVQGQDQIKKNRVLISLLPSFKVKVRAKVKGRVKVKGRGQGHTQGQSQISSSQRSILGARLCRVQQRAKKSNLISPRCLSVCWVIMQMRLIGF